MSDTTRSPSPATAADSAELGPQTPSRGTPVVLVINSGSSSLKFQLVDPIGGEVFASGIVERVGQPEGSGRIAAGESQYPWTGPVPDHTAAMRVVTKLFDAVGLSLADANVAAVGHRVVQGGARFAEPQIVDKWVRDQVYELGALAPLHNYAAVAGIDGARELLPDIPHVVVFDTAFFSQLPPASRNYALNKQVADEYRIHRYGAHGTSHEFIAKQVPGILGRDAEGLRQIVLHLGNGASTSAVLGGRPIDTSMGLTPLQGLVMGTRSGDIDPSVYVHLNRQAGMSPEQVDTLLNKQSGMQGLCGMSDFRDIQAAVERGEEDATLAMDIYAHRLRLYIGGYAFALGGLDAITFTAGIGENVAMVRKRALEGLEGFGIVLDDERNEQRSREARVISADDSQVAVLVVPTNEELAIAQQALDLAQASQQA